MKIRVNNKTFEVAAVILLKDKERILTDPRRRGRGTAVTRTCPTAASVRSAIRHGYDILCLIFSDGSARYLVNDLSQLDRAEQIGLAVNEANKKRAKNRGGVA